ncbi:flagellar protein FliT [Bacillus lacus]|uniref:Flagellar protein FliT n=1 Tax=Metabacillus lacus TaxID=1983721 RepID=A0A7X2IYM0_9BACI|nr:flagellar protein FliT [Metabacillus lacus]MRX72198.1 flagellar protein FliT [Metabacillus lacus]
MGVVEKLHDATSALLAVLDSEYDKRERDLHIDEIDILLEERDALLLLMSPPYSQKEMDLGQEILANSARIMDKLNALQSSIGQDLADLKKTKVTTGTYINPYQSASFDGMYYDKRK